MRSLVAAVVLLVGALMVPVATAGWWMRDAVVPTGSYLETVAPLATNEAVVAAVEDRLVEETMAQVDRAGRVPSGARQRVAGLVRVAVGRIVASPAFAEAWRTSNREVHDQVVAVLSGDSSAVAVRPDATVDIRLGTLATAVKKELVDAGLPFAGALPEVRAAFPIGNVDDLARAQRAYSLLERWGRLLPLAALAVVAAGLLVARHRARALGWTAFGSLVGLGLLGFGILVGRTVYLGSLPSGLSGPAARAFFDTVTAGLRRDLLVVAVGSVVVLLGSAVLGRRTSR